MKPCGQTRGDLADIMCLNRSYLEITPEVSAPQSAAGRPARPFFFLFDWQLWQPIGSQHDPREALLKIPPPGSRAPADGGFPLLRETQRSQQHERSRWSASDTDLKRSDKSVDDFYILPDFICHCRTKGRGEKRALKTQNDNQLEAGGEEEKPEAEKKRRSSDSLWRECVDQR